MGLRTIGRRLAAHVARKAGHKARKYVAPVLPALVTPIALGAGISAAALTLFFHLADDVREQDGVWRFDHDGLRMALSMRTPRRTLLMRSASAMARPEVMTVIGMVAMIVSRLSPRYRSRGVLLAVTLTGGGAIIGGIKHRFGRERPSLIEALAVEQTFSFPSGHAFIALCFYGTLSTWWIRSRSDWLRRMVVSFATVNGITLIGVSRIYLGVHYPSDVLAGYAAAVPWLIACLTAFGKYEDRLEMIQDGPMAPAALPAYTQED